MGISLYGYRIQLDNRLCNELDVRGAVQGILVRHFGTRPFLLRGEAWEPVCWAAESFC